MIIARCDVSEMNERTEWLQDIEKKFGG